MNLLVYRGGRVIELYLCVSLIHSQQCTGMVSKPQDAKILQESKTKMESLGIMLKKTKMKAWDRGQCVCIVFNVHVCQLLLNVVIATEGATIIQVGLLITTIMITITFIHPTSYSCKQTVQVGESMCYQCKHSCQKQPSSHWSRSQTLSMVHIQSSFHWSRSQTLSTVHIQSSFSFPLCNFDQTARSLIGG